MKKYILIFLSFMLFEKANAQQPYTFSQFFKVAPAFNPAFTGVDDLLDIKLAHRTQWGGFDGAPTTEYLGIYKGIRGNQDVSIKEYSLRISNPGIYDSLLAATGKKLRGKTKHGIGGYINLDAFGPFNQLKGNLNYSFHLKLKDQSFLAFGLAAGFINDKLDFNKIYLGSEQDDDQFLEKLTALGGNNTSIVLTPGILFYSPKFYIGYSAANLGEFSVQEVGLSGDLYPVTHYVLTGYQFPIADRTYLQTSVFGYYQSKNAYNVDLNVKVDFNRKGFAGVSYRKTNDLIAMAGLTLRNKFQFSYSYDMKVAGRNDLNNSSHELTLGFLLLNDELNTPYTW